MKVSRLFPVVALSMVAAMGCVDQKARDDIAELTAEFQAVAKDFSEYKAWLGKSDPKVIQSDTTVKMWFGFVHTAICNLEDRVNPPVNKTLCHHQGAHGTAPHPPPFS